MKITLNKKILISILLVFALLFVIHPCSVKAVLQSKNGTATAKKLDQWILQIRQMQSAGGTLGLGDTINSNGLTSDNKDLDIHMQKNTEYGALAILSASAYGNPNVITDGQTTTGNSTGAVMRVGSDSVMEWVAAGAGLTSTTYAKNAKARYINNDYGITTGEKYHAGDAMDIGNWHGSRSAAWVATTNASGIIRACSVSIFSYSGSSATYYSGSSGGGTAYYDFQRRSRACIVIGSGI